MKYYSTNHQSPVASLEEAVVKGLASDKGLFMPEAVKMLPEEVYDKATTEIYTLSLHDALPI